MKSNVSFLRRLGSIIYDFFLVFSFVFFIEGVVIIINNKQAITSSLFFYLLTLPLIYVYFSMSWVRGKQTLGMRAWKFEIIQKDGSHVTQKQSLIRFLLAIISMLFCFWKITLGKSLTNIFCFTSEINIRININEILYLITKPTMPLWVSFCINLINRILVIFHHIILRSISGKFLSNNHVTVAYVG